MTPEVREVGFALLPEHANARGRLFKMKEGRKIEERE